MRAVDLFAGAGGFTEAARAAGVSVIWAANHWPLAVEVHRANHPGTAHSCQDLQQADWSEIPGPVDLLLASPCCQGHSWARGKDRPHHDRQRSTAWAVVSCAEATEPAALIVENVPEFARWRLFPAWCAALEALGYSLTSQVIDAAACGVPQHRRRLFVVGSLEGPRGVHVPRPARLVPAADCIDWDYRPWPRIDQKARSSATLDRIAAGRARFGERFLMPYYGSGSGKTGRSLDRPLGTVTTLDRWAIVDGPRMRMLQPHELQRAMGFDPGYQLGGTRRERIQLLGNAVCPPCGEEVIRQVLQGAPRGQLHLF